MTLRLGVIGGSEGNGHPYSWSAIFNGYCQEAMEHCGYPVIPLYLEQQSWPDATIKHAKVTHIWTQDSHLSQSISEASYIEHIVHDPALMIGAVDGILLARDDADNHYAMAAPFLNAGLPVYIDKPICLSLTELEALYSLQRYPGQIFSCSALRYAKELQLSDTEKKSLGKIVHIQCTTPKDWDRYAVHIIEPLLLLIGDQGALFSSQRWQNDQCCMTTYVWESGLHASVSALGNAASPISLRIFGEKKSKELIFSDAFSAFKTALQVFTDSISKKDEKISYSFIKQVVDMIARGREYTVNDKASVINAKQGAGR